MHLDMGATAQEVPGRVIGQQRTEPPNALGHSIGQEPLVTLAQEALYVVE
jgi:hypothetical protein